MVNCEYRLVNGVEDADQFLVKVRLPVVPDRGELVNINGNPYRVHERAWAFGTDLPQPDCFELFAYIRVVRAWKSKQT